MRPSPGGGRKFTAAGQKAAPARTALRPTLSRIQRIIVACHACPRLVAHRERIAREKRRQFRECDYWGKPLPGFGDRAARVLLVGLAPAAHGGNRTGRLFTGDRSGDWLFDALYRAGFANQANSTGRGDGLRLRDAYLTAVVRCAPPDNKPLPAEIERCRDYLAQELRLLPNLLVVVALGRVAMDGYLAARVAAGQSVPRPRPRFAHAAVHPLGNVTLIASYHPSQQNTLTGRLTRPMFDRVFAAVRHSLERAGAAPRKEE